MRASGGYRCAAPSPSPSLHAHVGPSPLLAQAEEKLDVRLARYVELDFPQLTRAKIERIARSEPLRKRVGGTGPQGMRVGE